MESIFECGTVIKGIELKGMPICKILSEDLNMRGYQYQTGMNEDVNPLALEGCCSEGLHFALAGEICRFLEYGTKLALLSIPDDEDVFVDTWKFRTHRLEIKEIIPLSDIRAWEWMVQNGADINAGNEYAERNGYWDAVMFLRKLGAEPTVNDDYAVKTAVANGYLDAVKFLVGNGADVTVSDNYAIQHASYNGYLEMVEFLLEHGADATADNSYALELAIANGYLEIMKLLIGHGADVVTAGKRAVGVAVRSGHKDVLEFLMENGVPVE